MAAKKGNLSISSENIFPIIKKWVYSDHDIFVREMISNGCDAITKLKKLDMMGEYQLPDDYKPAIQVVVNPEDKTLKFIDNGLGMTADEVFSACVPAIFKLYAYDYKNNILGIGSGVVLSARGDAVTCGHLVNGVYRLVAEMYDGTKREVTIYSFDADADIAHIRVVGSTLPYLGVTTEVEEGDTVYALGYPGGGAATVTTGKVTDPENDDYLAPMIESTAQVISGNSGGALINDEGKVVGITVSSHSGGVPSYSVPIRYLNSLIGDGTAYSPGEYNRNHKPDASRCYSKHYPVPDFGTVTGVTLLGTIREGTTTTYYYDREEVEAGDKILLHYYAALGENTFYQFTGGSFTSSSTYPYSVKLYETSYDGIPAISVVVSSNSFASIGGLPQTVDFLLQEFVHYA